MIATAWARACRPAGSTSGACTRSAATATRWSTTFRRQGAALHLQRLLAAGRRRLPRGAGLRVHLPRHGLLGQRLGVRRRHAVRSGLYLLVSQRGGRQVQLCGLGAGHPLYGGAGVVERPVRDGPAEGRVRREPRGHRALRHPAGRGHGLWLHLARPGAPRRQVDAADLQPGDALGHVLGGPGRLPRASRQHHPRRRPASGRPPHRRHPRPRPPWSRWTRSWACVPATG